MPLRKAEFVSRTADDHMVKELTLSMESEESERETRVLEIGPQRLASGAWMQLKRIVVAAMLGFFASAIIACAIKYSPMITLLAPWRCTAAHSSTGSI